MTYFDEIGGEPVLTAVITEFVDRVFSDTMIGFLFARANKQRIMRFEYEHAAVFLGAPGALYTGRELAEAHKRHPILGGHFGRRRQILKLTLEQHGIPAHIREAWLAHQDALREQVTGDLVTQCNDAAAADRAGRKD
jgi:truncated hemoglobin YjbI